MALLLLPLLATMLVCVFVANLLRMSKHVYSGDNPVFRRLLNKYGIEPHWFDDGTTNPVQIASNTTATSGVVDPVGGECLNAIALGSGPQNRKGRRISIVDVEVRGIVQLLQFFEGQPQFLPGDFVRVWLVLDTQTNGVQFQTNELFTAAAPTNLLAPLVFLNPFNYSRFRILDSVDLIYESSPPISGFVGSEGFAAAYRGGAMRQFTLKWSGEIPVTYYDGVGEGTIASISDNSLHVVAFNSFYDSFIPDGWEQQIQYLSRVHFYSN